MSSGLANDTNPYAPAEDEATILSERFWLQGAIVSSAAYGAELVLFFMCFYLLYRQTNRNTLRQNLPIMIYISTIFILGTLFEGSLAKYTQLAFIDNRNFPGGPSGYENAMFSIPVDEIGNVSFVLGNWLCDAVIVWRCMVIYKGSRLPLWMIMFAPCLLYLASFTMGLLWLIQISETGPFENSSLNWTIPFFTLSLSLNILVTVAIVLRLLIYRHRIAKVMGSSHGSQYTSIAAMIVESAAIYSMFSIAFLIPFGLNSTLSQVFLQALGQVQISATLLIIFRVAQGKGWSSQAQSTFASQLGSSTGGGVRTGPSFQMNKVSHVQFRTMGSGSTGSREATKTNGSSFTAFDNISVPEGGPAETKDSTRAIGSFGSAKDEDFEDLPIQRLAPGIQVKRDVVTDAETISTSSQQGYRYPYDQGRSPV